MLKSSSVSKNYSWLESRNETRGRTSWGKSYCPGKFLVRLISVRNVIILEIFSETVWVSDCVWVKKLRRWVFVSFPPFASHPIPCFEEKKPCSKRRQEHSLRSPLLTISLSLTLPYSSFPLLFLPFMQSDSMIFQERWRETELNHFLTNNYINNNVYTPVPEEGLISSCLCSLPSLHSEKLSEEV